LTNGDQQSGRPSLPAASFRIGTNVVGMERNPRMHRALHDAIPFIENAEQVEVISVRSPERAPTIFTRRQHQ
jgi:hypothetical protein